MNKLFTVCEIGLKFECDIVKMYEDISYLGPYLQAIIMEHITSEYAEFLHSGGFNPYSQSVFMRDGEIIWKIIALNHDAEAGIIQPLLHSNFSEFFLKAAHTRVRVTSKSVRHIPATKVTSLFYEENPPFRHTIRFLSATAFKQQGSYVFMPEPRLVLQSLALKYGALFDNDPDLESEFIDIFEKSVKITSYRIQSKYFPVERVKIPGFIGQVTYQVRGAKTLQAYIATLLHLGEFCGIGIKTSMGMGAMQMKSSKTQLSNGKE